MSLMLLMTSGARSHLLFIGCMWIMINLCFWKGTGGLRNSSLQRSSSERHSYCQLPAHCNSSISSSIHGVHSGYLRHPMPMLHCERLILFNHYQQPI